jgi:uncharacterized protein (TIGR02246 family)
VRETDAIIRFKFLSFRRNLMIHRTVRLSIFATAATFFLAFAGCQSSGSNVNTATSNSNAAVANANANAQGDSSAKDKEEISRLLDEYNDALLKHDADTLGRIWADDLSFVNLRGQLLNKQERLGNIKTGATDLNTAEVSERNVRMYGNTAVATLVVKIKGQYSGEAGDGEFRITTVWAKPKGNWQMVATQMTPITK